VTPFGKRLRELRRERDISAKEMAAGLGVSPAYLSALEHGRRGKPNKRFVHRICQYLGIIWDEAEALQAVAALSHPRVVVETAGLSPEATELANRLAQQIAGLDEETVARWLAELREGRGAQPERAKADATE
jgi:transcriptional regulator with XRE-family HTH domain